MNLLKQFRKPYVSMLMAFTILFISCNSNEISESSIQNKEINSNIDNSYLLRNSDERLLTDAQVEEIGNLHNEYLNEMISNIDFENVNNIDLSSYPNELILNVDCELTNEEKQYIATTFENKDLEDIKDNLSTEVYNFALEVKNSIYQSDNHEELVVNLNSVERDARSALIGTDLDEILVMIVVAKKSSYFWEPIENGGSGVGDNYNTLISNELGKTKHISDDIVMSDCIAALDGMGMWALGALILGGPVTIAAYVVSVGLTSAAGSLKFYLFEYNP